MGHRRGFKTEANKYARDLRTELGLRLDAPLSPWKLADHLAIPIVTLAAFEQDEPGAVHYLTKCEPDCFSAVTVFHGSRRMVVHNDAHHRHRQASNLAHELSHAILGHPPTAPFNELGCRNFNKEIEAEANWLGPALLISEEAALQIARTRMSLLQAVEHYSASKEVISMRLNLTGAYRRIQRFL